ncbi:MAG: 23S rRNA (uracil(1939)-C(5))-methyltransferase RlmD, partial [Acetatifactor sp.]|nr:23S rRNA (uracil(1939)-C(5))-methyltransferase RlmD [Acetatifactor sp.]
MVCLVLNKKMTSASYRKMKHPVEDRAVPAEDRAVPAEDRVVPAEDRVVPAEKRAVPAEDGKFLSYDSRSQLCSYEFIPEQGELLWKLGQIENMTSVSVNINADRTNVIMGREIYTIWGKSTFSDVIHMRDMTKEGFPFTGRELTFHISPLSFYQVNPVQTEKLYSTALEFAGLTGQETVWDLYCGIGTISLFMAGSAKKVYGVEIVPQAIEDARENARRNGITNAEFFVGKAEEVLPKFYARGERDSSDSGMLHPDVIVVDPPRKGCDEACLATMLKMQPKRIVYVSCDPATLARDVRVLCDGGYEVKRIRGCDMFSQSVHVETVCLLSKLREAKHQVSVTLDMDERNLTSAESKATYEEIKRYVAEHNDGMKVSSLNIAQVKR